MSAAILSPSFTSHCWHQIQREKYLAMLCVAALIATVVLISSQNLGTQVNTIVFTSLAGVHLVGLAISYCKYQTATQPSRKQKVIEYFLGSGSIVVTYLKEYVGSFSNVKISETFSNYNYNQITDRQGIYKCLFNRKEAYLVPVKNKITGQEKSYILITKSAGNHLEGYIFAREIDSLTRINGNVERVLQRIFSRRHDTFEPAFRGVGPTYPIMSDILHDLIQHSNRDLNLTLGNVDIFFEDMLWDDLCDKRGAIYKCRFMFSEAYLVPLHGEGNNKFLLLTVAHEKLRVHIATVYGVSKSVSEVTENQFLYVDGIFKGLDPTYQVGIEPASHA